MERFLPSEVASLVYGYLESSNCKDAANKFLEQSPNLTNCLAIRNSSERFNCKRFGYSLQNILDEYCDIRNLASEYLQKLPDNLAARHQQCGSLVDQLRSSLDATCSTQTALGNTTVPLPVPSEALYDSTQLHEKIAENILKVISNKEPRDNVKKVETLPTSSSANEFDYESILNKVNQQVKPSTSKKRKQEHDIEDGHIPKKERLWSENQNTTDGAPGISKRRRDPFGKDVGPIRNSGEIAEFNSRPTERKEIQVLQELQDTPKKQQLKPDETSDSVKTYKNPKADILKNSMFGIKTTNKELKTKMVKEIVRKLQDTPKKERDQASNSVKRCESIKTNILKKPKIGPSNRDFLTACMKKPKCMVTDSQTQAPVSEYKDKSIIETPGYYKEETIETRPNK